MTRSGWPSTGWCYLNVAIDGCTREIAAWARRKRDAVTVLDAGVTAQGIEPASWCSAPTTASPTRAGLRARLAELEATHRRGGYRDPESQAFIEAWFSKLKERCVWREEFETLEDARTVIGRLRRALSPPPPSVSALRTAKEVRQTWDATQEIEALRSHAA